MLYSDPNNLLEARINEALKGEEESIVSDLIKLSLLRGAEKDSSQLVFTEIYKLLGLEKFTELIALVNGRTIKFPTEEKFKNAVLASLAYYYRECEGKDWEEIKSLLDEKDLNTIKYGIQNNRMKDFLKTMAAKRLKSTKNEKSEE